MAASAVTRGSTREEASVRAERIRQGLQSYAVLREDLATAYRARDWIALGYPSWDLYVDAEFTTATRLSLPRDERRELVAYFREQGMSTRAIAAATGVHKDTVRNDLAGGENSPPNTSMSNVVGIDGKSYRAVGVERAVVEAETVDVPAAEAETVDVPAAEVKRSPAEFFSSNEEQSDVYAMTDGVTDEQFEAALAEAKAESDLSRANVVRKVKALATPSTADAALPRAPRRRPLTDQADDAGWAIRKAGDRITRILADDRYPKNKEQVRLALRGHLLFVTETVAVALEQLGNQSTLEDS